MPSPKPFQFLADAREIVSGPELARRARDAESIGYHELVIPDHLIPQLGPIAGCAWIAAATTKLRVGSFVHNNDLRHPVLLAQELASIDVLSEGRLDVAIGAGWNKPEYDVVGLAFDPTPVRQARLIEAIAVLKGAFADTPDDGFSFTGESYRITALDGQPKPVQRPHPPFLIGGGGRKTIELAAREADIIGLAPRILPGIKSDPRSVTVAGTREKIEWVRAATPERFDDLVFNVYPTMTGVSVTDHALAEARDVVAAVAERTGIELTTDELLDSPHIFIGTIDALEQKLIRVREELGISSFMVGTVGPLDPLVERLAGR
ncbi:MAG TPA: TIGR03621 family F420-dependent LLM class oxidoreductase [Candidatus Limnocylindrales bacterium]